MTKKPKKRGLDYLMSDMGDQQDDFLHAADCTEQLIKEFDLQGIDRGSALGGILTETISHIISGSPNPSVALGLIASCITSAAVATELDDFKVH
jgi:hypothetical protein|tara:strand:+ start:559 stop:840 length:282 start_codon:yes stop_codon:yes gene_type:complete